MPWRRAAGSEAALRRIATLVARGAAQAEVFAVVAREVAGCLDVPLISIVRFETDGMATHVGVWGRRNPASGWHLVAAGRTRRGRDRVPFRPFCQGRVCRVRGDPSKLAPRGEGIRSAVAVPIIANGRPWGTMMALSTAATPQPASTKGRLASFTELVATAIANTQARQELQQLADEQAALREVATLVAQGAEPGAVYDAVCVATGRLIDAASVNLARFTPRREHLDAGWLEPARNPRPSRHQLAAGRTAD